MNAFQFGFVLQLVWLLCLCASDNDSICSKLQDPSQSTFPFFAIGLTAYRFLLITHDLQVYNMSPTSLDTTRHRLNLSLVGKPVPFAEMWPSVYQDQQSQLSQVNKIAAVSVMFNTADYMMLFVNPPSTDTQQNIIFKINQTDSSPAIYKNLNYVPMKGAKGSIQWISTETGHFYQMQHSDTLHLMRMKPLKRIGNNLRLDSNGLVGKYFGTPSSTSNEVLLKSDLTKCQPQQCAPVRWLSLTGGFVAQKQFYFFNDETVFIFKEDTYDSEEPVPLIKVPFKQFFVCSQSANSSNATGSTNTSLVKMNRTKLTLLKVSIFVSLFFTLVVAVLILFTCDLCLNQPTVPTIRRSTSRELNYNSRHVRHVIGKISNSSVVKTSKQSAKLKAATWQSHLGKQLKSTTVSVKKHKSVKKTSTDAKVATARSLLKESAKGNPSFTRTSKKVTKLTLSTKKSDDKSVLSKSKTVIKINRASSSQLKVGKKSSCKSKYTISNF